MNTLPDACARHHKPDIDHVFFSEETRQRWSYAYRRHRSAVFQLCLKLLECPIEAEDATMDIFALLPRHLSRYRIRHFRPWLLRLSRNHCRQRLESKQRQHLVLTQWSYLNLRHRRQARWWEWQKRRSESLHRALRQLKAPQRNCLTSFYFDGLSYRETGRKWQLPTKAVKSHIQNGKRNLEQLLPEDCRYWE